MKITEAIKQKRLYMDGATGTTLQNIDGLSFEKTEELCKNAPEIIKDLHLSYLEAGADIICANTFGLSRLSFDDPFEIAKCAFACADSARQEYFAKHGKCDKYVAYDMGPTGRIVGRRGNLDFEDAVALFRENAQNAEALGFDLIFIETMNDLRETKAALIGAKEGSSLPVFVSNAYDESGKMLFGTPPLAAIAMLESMGADAIGFNCSCGPDKLLGVLEDYVKYSSLPIIAKPNAGLPGIDRSTGKTYFDVSPSDFAENMEKMAKMGACILGGCCGTTAGHIEAAVSATKDLPYTLPTLKDHTVVSSEVCAKIFDKAPVLIGERINPTGKKAIKEALRSANYSYILSEGIKQEEAGVHVLDVNAGLPDIDEAEALLELTLSLSEVCSLPLQIDSASPAAMEKALRQYVGKPLVNSVNASKASMDAIFPLVKKYGGAVICLTMDERGIPATAEERFSLARLITERAREFGIDQKDLIFDPLTMTVSSDPMSARVTLDSLKMITKELGAKTCLGVSNVSFGLPARDRINSAFFTLAMECGLSAAIMNPFSEKMMEAYACHLALNGLDPALSGYVEFSASHPLTGAVAPAPQKSEQKSIGSELGDAVLKGLTEIAVELAKSSEKDPLEVIDSSVIPALSTAGELFSSGKIFLPQLLLCASTATAVFDELKKRMPPKSTGTDRTVVMATVKGDIHDIGKNIVCTLLESFGFNVLDLGKDVDETTVAEACKNARLLGLSALMTTTVSSMESTIRLVRQLCPHTKIMVGGAVLTSELAHRIGADYYCACAMDSVNCAKEVFA